MNNKEKARLKELRDLKEKIGLDKLSELERNEFISLKKMEQATQDPKKAKEDQRIADQLAKANEKAIKGEDTKMRVDDPKKRRKLKKIAEKMLMKIITKKVDRVQGEKMKSVNVMLRERDYEKLKDLTEDLIEVSNNDIFKVSNVMWIILSDYVESYENKK